MKLHEKVHLQTAIISQQNEDLKKLRFYLNSTKFGADVLVNKNDILMRLDEDKQALQHLLDQLT